MIKVSVIVPVYNVEKYLDRCVNSLINQTLRDIEIILVDDNSIDRSSQICDEWAKKDRRIKVIHKSVNEGLGFARNTGIEAANGEYITFPDSDDYLDSYTFEKLYEYAKDGNQDAIYYEFNTEDYPGFHAVAYPSGIYKSKKEIENVMLDMIGAEPEYQSDVKFQVSAAKVLYKLDLIKKYNLQFVSERKIISEDLIWNLEFLHVANTIRTTNDRLYHYCLNQSSLTHKYRPDRYQKQCEMVDYLGKFKNWFGDEEVFQLRLHRTKLFYLRTYILSLIKQKQIVSVKHLFNDKETNRLLKAFPIYRMPYRYRVFFYIFEKKLMFMLYVLYWSKLANDFRRIVIGKV